MLFFIFAAIAFPAAVCPAHALAQAVVQPVTRPGTQPLAQGNLPPTVAAALERASIPLDAAGFFVHEVGSGPGFEANKPLVSFNASRPMNPASVMKLVTTYAALELLGPAFTWKTVAASSAPLRGDVLEGDLILEGAGDPALVLEKFWLLLLRIRASGVREIRGDLVLDRSRFEKIDYDVAAFDGEPLKPYNVAPDALLVNFKTVTFSFIPDEAKRRARVVAEPELVGMRIDTVKLADGACGDWKERVGARFEDIGRIRFTGAYPASCGEQRWPVSLLDHPQYVGALFRNLWAAMGGKLRGQVRGGRKDEMSPADARAIVVYESASLAEIVRDINKYSNNVMAKELFLDVGAEAEHLPASPELAERAIRALFVRKRLALPDLVIENGSGLSRRERISALGMGRVLLAAWASPVMPEFVASLPLAGYDGTMRKRLAESGVSGRAHIKTGSLEGVRAFAGYVLAASGRRYVVVGFVNHPKAEAARAAHDELLEWVFENG